MSNAPTATPTPETAATIEYQLRVHEDKMRVLLTHPDPLADVDALVEKILTDFEPMELAEAPDGPRLVEILNEVCSPDEPIVDCALLQGREPIPAQDGRLEWTRDFFTEGWAVDEETGAINFWEKLERRSVHQGESLLKVIHPIEGTPGVNVFGLELVPGKPAKVKVRCGKGVQQAEQEGHTAYKASCDGRVRYADGTVAVDDVYAIRGDVSLETGNIHHTGSVVIDGEVGAGARVEADGDIVVKGMIEQATIRCGGSLTVAGGILGSEDTHIEVTGSVQAKYLSEVDLTAGGDIIVLNEIAHSSIRSRGKVEVAKGRIAGGETIALKGIQIAEAGASGSTLTLLIAGMDHALEAKIQPRRDKIEKLEGAHGKITSCLSKAGQSPQRSSDSFKQKLAELSEKAGVVSQAILRENTAIEQITHEALAEAVEEVVIFAELWSGTTIQLGEYKHVVKSSVQKPRIAQIRKKKVRILPMGEGNMPEE